jgi:hypothetical protein
MYRKQYVVATVSCFFKHHTQRVPLLDNNLREDDSKDDSKDKRKSFSSRKASPPETQNDNKP